MMRKLRDLSEDADELYILSVGLPIRVGPDEWLKWQLEGHDRVVRDTPIDNRTRVTTIFWGVIKGAERRLFETAVLCDGRITVVGNTSTIESAMAIHKREVARVSAVSGPIVDQPIAMQNMGWVGHVVPGTGD